MDFAVKSPKNDDANGLRREKSETTNENVTMLKLDLLKYIRRFAHIKRKYGREELNKSTDRNGRRHSTEHT